MEPIASNSAPPVPATVTLHLDKPPQSRTGSSPKSGSAKIFARKWIGQKKAIRQSQFFAVEVLLKFCGGAVKVL
jgi:hypothetical protein